MSMLEKCKHSLPVVQRIAESTNDDEVMLFEALNLHDELRQVISRCDELEAALESGGEPVKISNSTEVDSHVHIGNQSQVNTADPPNVDTTEANSSVHVGNYSDSKRADPSNADTTKVDSPVHFGYHSSEAKRTDPLNEESTESISDVKKPGSPKEESVESSVDMRSPEQGFK